jgi:hypothetical protein
VFSAACAHLPVTRSSADDGPQSVVAGYGNVPLSFTVNQGQTDEHVKFLASGQGYSLFLTAGEAVLSLRAPTSAGIEEGPAVVRMRLLNANQHPDIAGLDRQPGDSNYFIGDASQWRRDVPNYGRVKYSDVYRGIDVVYYGNQQQLEYDVVVRPYADATRVMLQFDGVQKLSLDENGNLVLQTPGGTITQHKPVIYQNIDGTRTPVDGRYALGVDNRVGFDIAPYDPSHALVIDPVLSYSTYLGGTGNDLGHAIAVDSAGNAYVTGETNSLNFPTATAAQSTNAGSIDVFVTKINAAGSAIVYSTYLGGSSGDWGYAIAVDSAGSAYVTGQTDSGTPTITSVPFPTTAGARQTIYKLGGDAFVSKISPAGNALVYSTFLGGGGTERGYGIAVDGLGNAYVTGSTNSDNVSSGGITGGFPTVGPLQSNNNSPGNSDAFVSKLNATGSALIYSTYLGGSGSEFSIYGGAIAVDGDGNAYVGGSTGSTNFPGASSSTIRATNGGGVSDGFVAKLNAAGNALFYSTYLGGSAYDAVHGIAVNAAGEAFVTGYTDSANFPIFGPTSCVTIYLCRQLVLQETKGTGEDAFVARLNATGTALVYSTFLGGNGGERGYDIAVDSASNAYVSGWTTSTNFPIAAAFQPVNGGSNGDAFISAINASGAGVLYSTFLGANSGSETARGIALDAAGNAYVTGDTNSTNFPTAAPLQAARSGSIGTDAFVAKISAVQSVVGAPTDLIVTSVVGNTVTVSWRAPAAGVTPTGYVLEGGVSPGEVLASLPTSSTTTTYTFAVPSGAFYIRMHSLAPGQRSVASNEVRLFVNVPAVPSAPANLLALVNGSALTLAWTNTAAGGPPTAIIADVTGSVNLALGLPVSETFSIANVAAGTYAVSLRASNALGSGPSSNSVAFTIPAACSGVPGSPTNFVVTKNGNLITAAWELPAGGPAPTSYRLIITGAFNGEIGLTTRSITGAVGAGDYTLSVIATNACGSGTATSAGTVTIP